MTTAAIVLAGGASSRFGSDKLAAPLGGRPVLHHVLDTAAGIADVVVLVLAPGTAVPTLPATVGTPAGRPLLVTHDEAAHQGPLAGLAAGLAVLPPDADRALLLAGDMPTAIPAVLAALVEALAPGPGAPKAVTLEADPPHPLPMAVRPSIAPAVTGHLASGRRSLRALLEAVDSAVVPAATWRALDPTGATLRDVDTPADLAGR